MLAGRPATAQSRVDDIKAEWQAAVRSAQQSAASSAGASRGNTPGGLAGQPSLYAPPGSRRRQRAQSAHARSRLQQLENELMQMSRAGHGTPAERAQRLEQQPAAARGSRTPTVGAKAAAREPAALGRQCEPGSNAPPPQGRLFDAVEDSAVDNAEGFGTLKGFSRAPRLRLHAAGGSESRGGASNTGSHSGSFRGHTPSDSAMRPISPGSGGGGGGEGPLKHGASQVNPAADDVGTIKAGLTRNGSEDAFSETGFGPDTGAPILSDERGGWIHYDDIRRIINEETRKALVLGAANRTQAVFASTAITPQGDEASPAVGQVDVRGDESAAEASTSERMSTTTARAQLVSGLRWKNVGSTRPKFGVELKNAVLSQQLLDQTEFEQHEWDSLCVSGLRAEHYVGAGHCFFKPDIGGAQARVEYDDYGQNRNRKEEIPRRFPDGRINPYYLLADEQARSLTFLGFFGFSRRSLLRSKCIIIVNDGAWKALFVLGAICNSIYIAWLPGVDPASINSETEALFGWIDNIFLGLFYFELVVGWIAWGFAGHPNAWFNRDHFHRLDFFIFLVSIYELFTQWLQAQGIGVQSFTLRPLRLLRIIKVMTGLNHFASVKAILITLGDGVGQLMVVFGIFVAFMMIFAVFGMGVYRSSFSRRCVSLPVSVPACASDARMDWNGTCSFVGDPSDQHVLGMQGAQIVSSGYPFSMPCKIFVVERKTQAESYAKKYAALADGSGNHHTCDEEAFRLFDRVTQTCVSMPNPQGGFQHFDHIGGAVLAVLQVAVPDSSYDILHIALGSEPAIRPVTYLFMTSMSVFLTFLMLGLFVAVVTGTFARVRGRQAREVENATLRQREKAQADFEAWVSQQNGHETDYPSRPGSKYVQRPGSANVWAPVRTRPHSENQVVPLKSAFKSGASVDCNQQATSNTDPFAEYWIQERDQEEEANPNFTQMDRIAAQVAIACIVSEMEPRWPFVALDLACNLIFLAETLLNFIALRGFKGLLLNMKTRNEFLLVVVTAYGLASNITVLKLLPAGRIFRLMVLLPTLEDLLLSAVTSSKSLVNLIIFVSICLLCAGVTGRYLIGNAMDKLTRSNFGSFLGAIITVFQLLTGDSYSGIVYASLLSQESTYGRVFACTFVLSWLFIAQLLIKNLFVAVIIENFQVSRTMQHTKRPGYWALAREQANAAWTKFKTVGRVRRENMRLDKEGRVVTRADELPAALSLDIDIDALIASARYNPDIQHVLKDILPTNEALLKLKRQQEPERVLFMLQPNNPIRRFFVYLSGQPLFDTVVFSAIGCSCFFLIITPPYDKIPRGPADQNLEEPMVPKGLIDTLGLIFTLIFTVEFVSRVMAVGLIQTKHAYLKSGWNVMDTIVLICAIIDELQLFDGGNIAKIMRLARALRPLRLMKRNAGMKMLIDALIGTLYPVVYVGIFASLTLFSFALVGVGLFRGLLYRCTTVGAEYPGGVLECSGSHVLEEHGFMVPRAWVNAPGHFDTLPRSMLTLFQINTIKYVNIMQDIMDVTEHNQSPSYNHSQWNCVFVVVYIFIGSFFIMNLFVGFIVDGFNSSKGEDTEVEATYSRFLRAVREFAPHYEIYRSPTNLFSRRLRLVCESSAFITVSMSSVIVSIVFMLADHRDPNPVFYSIFTVIDTVLFWVLVGETMIVAMAYGPQGWLNDSWKAFDLMVCLGSAAGVISSRREVETVSRCFRIFRIIRLMKMIKPIRIILNTLVSSLPQLVNIAMLLLMFWSMFAVLFVQLFSTTKFGMRLGPTANFKTYPDSLLAVYQMIVGDEWMILMSDCSVQWPECTPVFSSLPEYGDIANYGDLINYQGPDYEFGDCGNMFAAPMFVIFLLFCQSVMLNLFIGMILDNFAFITDEESKEDQNDMDKQPSTSQVYQISRIFIRYDFTQTGMVALSLLYRIMLDCPAPLGFGRQYGSKEDAAMKMIRAELNFRASARSVVRRKSRGVWKRFLSWVMKNTIGLQQNPYMDRSMSFEDFMLTLLHWRRHEKVPPTMRVSRARMVPEILATTQALIMRDFLWRIGPSRRRKMQVNARIYQRRNFFRWSIQDIPFTRYRMHRIEEKEAANERAKRSPLYRNIKQAFPSCHSNVLLAPLDEPPDGLITVPHAIRDYLKYKYQAPHLGVESFLEMVRGGSAHVERPHFVVCRFVDERTVLDKKLGEMIFLADFTSTEWDCWHSSQSENDAFLEPCTKANRVDEPDPPWRTIDIKLNKIKVQALRRKGAEMTKEQAALRRRAILMGVSDKPDYNDVMKVFNPRELCGIGTLRAVQSYLAEDASFEGGVVAQMRLIFGSHPLPPADLKVKEAYDIGLHKCYDAVLQVLGYVPARKNKMAERRASEADALEKVADDDDGLKNESWQHSVKPSDSSLDEDKKENAVPHHV